MRVIVYFIFFVSALSFGQTRRFYYEAAFKPYTNYNVLKESVVLDINKDYNYFYSAKYLLVDSLNNKNRTANSVNSKFDEIVKWIKKDNIFEFVGNLSPNYYFYKSKVSLEWKLEEDKKKIGDYIVQKATTQYGGRSWVAWFTSEIPLPYGPYVFNGLPGMILEVYDTEDHYHFTFYRNTNLSEEEDTEKLVKKYLIPYHFNIEKKDWKRILLNYYHDPIPEYKRGDAKRVKDDGREYTPHEYRELEKRIQAGLRKSNPIDLDDKPDYK